MIAAATSLRETVGFAKILQNPIPVASIVLRISDHFRQPTFLLRAAFVGLICQSLQLASFDFQCDQSPFAFSDRRDDSGASEQLEAGGNG